MTEDSNQSELQQRIQELENRRLILNQKLMDADSKAEVNEIERELWALRAAIRYHKSQPNAAKP
jgi:hypothetical protein